jgi:outer membrane protein OmpA-like peptidoglycan-associated protein
MTTKQRLQIFVVTVLAIAVVGSGVTGFVYLFAPHRLPKWSSATTPAPSEIAPSVPETKSEPEPVASTEPKPEPESATLSSEPAMSVGGKKSRGGSTELKVDQDELPSREKPVVTEPPSEENKEENSAVRSQVLARIDLMPHLTAGNRTRLYRAVDRAKNMRKLMVVSFDTGQTVLNAPAAGQLVEFINERRLAEWERLMKNPTTVFVVLGYADTTGDDKLNLRISTARAENLVKVLHGQARIKSEMEAVGMGESEMFGREQLAKNRIVEVWAVIP